MCADLTPHRFVDRTKRPTTLRTISESPTIKPHYNSAMGFWLLFVDRSQLWFQHIVQWICSDCVLICKMANDCCNRLLPVFFLFILLQSIPSPTHHGKLYSGFQPVFVFFTNTSEKDRLKFILAQPQLKNRYTTTLIFYKIFLFKLVERKLF